MISSADAIPILLRVDPEAITVPYALITDDIRRNRGFVDLRGHPDKAKDIAEGNDSPALRNLLVRVANVGSAILTLGCDLGAHQEPTQVPLRRRAVAGGYIQFASVHYDHAKRQSYAAFANAVTVKGWWPLHEQMQKFRGLERGCSAAEAFVHHTPAAVALAPSKG